MEEGVGQPKGSEEIWVWHQQVTLFPLIKEVRDGEHCQLCPSHGQSHSNFGLNPHPLHWRDSERIPTSFHALAIGYHRQERLCGNFHRSSH